MYRFFYPNRKSKKKNRAKQSQQKIENDRLKYDKPISALNDKIKELETQIREAKQRMINARGLNKKIHKREALKLLKQKKLYELEMKGIMDEQLNMDMIAFEQVFRHFDGINMDVNTISIDEYNEEDIGGISDNEIHCDLPEDILIDELNELDHELDDPNINENEILDYINSDYGND